MQAELRLVLIEDADDDAALVLRALRQAGFSLNVLRVQTHVDFVAALEQQPDLIVSDYSLPSYGATAALAYLRECDIDLPFIVVSGTIDEESAVTILKAGAHDFVTKQNLARLGPAIHRGLEEARHRAERRDARRQLRVQRDFLRLVIDSNPGLIFAKGWDGRFTLANRAMAELYGTTVDELVGKTVEDLRRPNEDAAAFLRAAREVKTSGQARYVPAEPVTDARTNEVRWFETRVVPLVLPHGTPQVLGIGTEITQRLVAEEALRVSEEQFRQSQKMEAVGQLAGGIAHDFNNLLTAIIGYSDLLLDSVGDNPALAEDIKEIRKAGERASGLTKQLLAFSRKQVLHPRVLDLNQVVEDVERMLRRLIGEDIQFEIVTARGLHRVTADPGQIEQVLINLAVNARDAMPRGGKLTIETANATRPPEGRDSGESTTEDWVRLTVTDTGTGMSPEVCKRIFEPFFTTKGPGKGTGLGLSMAYGVVAQSGGLIGVDSERDRGTRFTIHLPAVSDREQSAAPSGSAPGSLAGTETILLVEDEPAIRELVRKVLGGYGYTVLEASDTDHALAIAEEHRTPIHLLVSDIVMPRLSGPELAQRIVLIRPEMRVLYMSGFGSRLATESGSLSSSVALLHKPFTPEALGVKVRECLDVAALRGGRRLALNRNAVARGSKAAG